ncbi:IS1182 family transposase [Noviherbaspirillum sedimenti]|uniref:IS1182 family transposase n=1 Tax=Noviherbaspirillum sedimenti TaxID=2320865 RepID=A0A3A3G4X5_9BURK|nr:IS1182 family transposase [Noviherbaspirillum sedimenti]RJG00285.1 IS1182 family transposase [Noviherbaspirillum sedimenti]RJG02807.1 IS1182 family transposase [Noviherbaspirillum sedimenti]RJG02991.1 IS1182 family transposase [Noviherbaspirillum sedimenti]RJG03542.1 IS1182 family transposase [Noviherbaspirillum sedimenti]RJG03611.1 IS1182 family transposase [Noviherbaspirillum sedimenti]
MTSSYLPYDPQQQMLLPPALQEWLPDGHLAYYISDTIDALDLSTFHARYAGGGPRNQPFHPAMMVKVLVYGYATGVFSSRKLAKKLHEDVAFRVLAAGNYPAHRTICDFRAFHLKELSDLFVQVVKLARECGLVKLGTIAVDGTKIKANASRHKAMSYERMKKSELELKAQIDALLAKAKAADLAEKNEPALDIPAEISRREDRLAAIGAARARLEERQRQADTERGRSADDDNTPPDGDGKALKKSKYKYKFGEPKPKAQDNFTDPESRIMKRAGGGFDYSYNAQAAVDDTAHIIVAAELTNSGADSRQLPAVLAAVKANTGDDPHQVVADAGYRSEAVFETLRDHPAEIIVALGREGRQALGIDPNKRPLSAAMAERFKSTATQDAYRRRKWLSEPPNGWIKHVLGFRQFSMRGIAKAQAEWKLVCAALNLRRMANMMCA